MDKVCVNAKSRNQRRRLVLLGCTVLLLSMSIVGLIHIGCTTPEFVSRLRVYVNPEASRICAIARTGFSGTIATLGVLGCFVCIFFALRKAKPKDEHTDSYFELNEAAHASYALHAAVLIFICVIGIVSRRVAVDTSPGILIELTPSETGNRASTSFMNVGKVFTENPSRKKNIGWRSKTTIVDSNARLQPKQRITASTLASKTERPEIAMVESRASQVVASENEVAELNVESPASMGPTVDHKDSRAGVEEASVAVPAPETAATPLPFVTAMARPRSFIVPNFALLLENNPVSPSSSVYVASLQASELDSGVPLSVF